MLDGPRSGKLKDGARRAVSHPFDKEGFIMISHHTALIYTMVLVSAADRDMTDAEIKKIGEIIGNLPVFRDFERKTLSKIAASCANILADENGLDKAFEMINASLSPKLRETAYALACDVAAADRKVPDEEARILEMIRHRLNIERLVAAAIERAARARFAIK
jgi:tellurite resistance protein